MQQLDVWAGQRAVPRGARDEEPCDACPDALTRELRRSGLPEDGANAAVGGVLGGLVGAKVIWSIEFAGTAPFAALLFSRGGLSWFGGFVGGIGVGLWLLRHYRIPMVSGLAAAAPALAFGHAIGRVGSSGTATGPHLDYRIIKNGTYVNPLVELKKMPKGDPVAPDAREAFERVRDAVLARFPQSETR